AHYLEAWGDARAFDGTTSIVQPLIEPLYEGKTAYEVLALFSDNYDRQPYEMVRNYWSSQQASLSSAKPAPTSNATPATEGSKPRAASTQAPPPAPAAATVSESWWRKCLHDGFTPNPASQTKSFSAKADLANSPPPPPAGGALQVIFRADPTIHDGRFANNG